MKLLIFFVVFLTGILHPQGIGGGTFLDCELNIQVQNTSGFVTFVLTPIGANWANNTGCLYPLYNDDTTWISTFTDFNGNGYEDCNKNGYTYKFYGEPGFREVTGCALREPQVGLVPIRSGFYRIDVWENDIIRKYVYFDWRDTGFPVTACPSCWGHNDMTIRYDVLRDELWFWKLNNVPISNDRPEEVLNQGQIINWADRNCTHRTTTYLEDFWENCLVVTNNGNGNPKLVWGPNPDFENILGYKIYRAVHWVPNPDPIVYSLIATVDDETFDYTDTQLKLTGNGDYVWYYVKAYNNQGESSQSNVVHTRAGFYKKSNSEKLSSTSYGLNQNFPNPFNPTTQITYSLAQDGFVTLKVFDILGKEVADLVNERMTAGSYSVEFNAANLPSGIYIYKLTSVNFTESKKLILLK